jgi:hypothetical protein
LKEKVTKKLELERITTRGMWLKRNRKTTLREVLLFDFLILGSPAVGMAGFEAVEVDPSFTIEIVSVGDCKGKVAFGVPPPNPNPNPPPPLTEVLVDPVALGPVVLGLCCCGCGRRPPRWPAPLPEKLEVGATTCMGVVVMPLSLSRFLPFFLDCAFFLLSRFCLMISSVVPREMTKQEISIRVGKLRESEDCLKEVTKRLIQLVFILDAFHPICHF